MNQNYDDEDEQTFHLLSGDEGQNDEEMRGCQGQIEDR